MSLISKLLKVLGIEKKEPIQVFIYSHRCNKYSTYTIKETVNGFTPMVSNYVHQLPDRVILIPFTYWCETIEEAQGHIEMAIEDNLKRAIKEERRKQLVTTHKYTPRK